MTTSRSKRHITREIIQDARVLAHRTQLQAEIALVDRSIVRQQAAFGVALYDTLLPLVDGDSADGTSYELRETTLMTNVSIDAWKTCHSAIQPIATKLAEQQREIDEIRERQEQQQTETSNHGSISWQQRARQWIADTAMLGQLTLQCTLLLPREMQRHKEQLGMTVWDSVWQRYTASDNVEEEEKSKERMDAQVRSLLKSTADAMTCSCESREAKQRELAGLLDVGVV